MAEIPVPNSTASYIIEEKVKVKNISVVGKVNENQSCQIIFQKKTDIFFNFSFGKANRQVFQLNFAFNFLKERPRIVFSKFLSLWFFSPSPHCFWKESMT